MTPMISSVGRFEQCYVVPIRMVVTGAVVSIGSEEEAKAEGMEAAGTVVMYPFQAISHLGPMVELAKLTHIHQPSISFVILITPAPVDTGSTKKYINNISGTTPFITFHILPTLSLPQDFYSDFIDLAFRIPELYCPVIQDTLVAISQKSSIKAVILDILSNAAFQVSTSLNLPTYYFGFIVNSFVGYEQRATDALNEDKCIPEGPTPPAYLVGPLIVDGGDQTDPNGCLKWLDSQPPKSVVFVCFGSMCVFNKEQLKEIAIGLERSEQRFLWVVRNPQWHSGVQELDLDAFPQGFLTRTQDKGLVVKNWAPQRAILSHESVGGFMFHCGWNSIFESLVEGVPMVAWPLYKEQKMNRAFIVEEIKVALAVEMSSNGFVTGEEVSEKVRRLMEGEEGTAVRERALEMSARANAAVAHGGSRGLEFQKLIQSWLH
ncbi:hypothetical protein E3N88_03616 [Mikania micrantha]|uniref:Glycosyltransferase n=1 Tax=Mikania micrantha TaxID=192012 RepID=A0A5N6QA00_9ASTR|nr:hypothetical protein E3N88_03616 [Mikania micrantha]